MCLHARPSSYDRGIDDEAVCCIRVHDVHVLRHHPSVASRVLADGATDTSSVPAGANKTKAVFAAVVPHCTVLARFVVMRTSGFKATKPLSARRTSILCELKGGAISGTTIGIGRAWPPQLRASCGASTACGVRSTTARRSSCSGRADVTTDQRATLARVGIGSAFDCRERDSARSVDRAAARGVQR
jgi:hypothetical protein